MKKIIQYKNMPLVYHVYGEGVAVILLHGFAETNTVWKNQPEFLSRYCKVIIPDLPGSGGSELFEVQSTNLDIEDLADSIHTIIEDENLKDCIILGHSMGGYITLSFVEKYPAVVKAFGLVHSTAFADSKEKKLNRKRGIEMMKTYGSYAFLKTTAPNLFSAAFKEKNAFVLNQFIEEGKLFKKENLQQYYWAMMQRFDKTNVLKNSKVPVLFVMGTEDVAAPVTDVLKQVHQPEISYIHIIENTGHMSMLEMPDKLNELLKNFINETE